MDEPVDVPGSPPAGGVWKRGKESELFHTYINSLDSSTPVNSLTLQDIMQKSTDKPEKITEKSSSEKIERNSNKSPIKSEKINKQEKSYDKPQKTKLRSQ